MKKYQQEKMYNTTTNSNGESKITINETNLKVMFVNVEPSCL